jgi:RNA polymerase sigma-70 factor (ECF subfamily)
VQLLSDLELLGLLAQRDEAALRELVERHSGWLLLRLKRRSPDEDLAHEALHDTFVAVWSKPSSYRGDGDVSAWLWGIAVRQLITRLRKVASPTPVTREVILSRLPSMRSAEDELLDSVHHGALDAALRTLSPELIKVLQATVMDGLSTKEAAQLLGIPHGTVKSRVRIAKSKLRAQLLPVEAW